MPRFLVPIAMVFAFVCISGAAPDDAEKLIRAAHDIQLKERNKESEKAIRGVLDSQVVAWNKGDLDGFMDGYWNDDKLFYISGANAAQGWKALKERYQKAYQADGKEMGKLKFTDLNVEMLAADAALVRGKWEVTMSKETVGGWFTLIVKKFPTGWKVTHDHTSK